MTYSVWNNAVGRYDYYEAPGDRFDATPDPKHLVARPKPYGYNVAGYPLPMGARRVGSGAIARGTIATSGGGELGDLPFLDGNFMNMVLLLGAGYLAIKYLR